MIYVYIAGPYSKGVLLKNVQNAIAAGEELLKYGFSVYVPHLTHYWEWYHAQHPYEFWLEFDKAWLRKCDCVLRIPGESSGSDAEVVLAQSLNMPVFNNTNVLKEFYQVESHHG